MPIEEGAWWTTSSSLIATERSRSSKQTCEQVDLLKLAQVTSDPRRLACFRRAPRRSAPLKIGSAKVCLEELRVFEACSGELGVADLGPAKVRFEPENFSTFCLVSGRAESLHQPSEGHGSDASVLPLLPGSGSRVLAFLPALEPGILSADRSILSGSPSRPAAMDRSGRCCTPTPTTTLRTAPSSGHAPTADPTRERSSTPR